MTQFKEFKVDRVSEQDFGKSYRIFIGGRSYWLTPSDFDGFEDLIKVAEDDSTIGLLFPFRGIYEIVESNKEITPDGEIAIIKSIKPNIGW